MAVTRLVGLMLVVGYVVILNVLAALDIQGVFEPGLLLPILNTLFAGVMPIVVACVAAKTYLKTNSATILFMGCEMLGFYWLGWNVHPWVEPPA
jgi:hypothetical protein